VVEEDCMIDCDNICIEDQPIDGSNGNCEFADEQQEDQSNPM